MTLRALVLTACAHALSMSVAAPAVAAPPQPPAGAIPVAPGEVVTARCPEGQQARLDAFAATYLKKNGKAINAVTLVRSTEPNEFGEPTAVEFGPAPKGSAYVVVQLACRPASSTLTGSITIGDVLSGQNQVVVTCPEATTADVVSVAQTSLDVNWFEEGNQVRFVNTGAVSAFVTYEIACIAP